MEEAVPLKAIQESGTKANLNVTSSSERKLSVRATASKEERKKSAVGGTSPTTATPPPSPTSDAEKPEAAATSKETGAIPKKQPSVKN